LRSEGSLGKSGGGSRIRVWPMSLSLEYKGFFRVKTKRNKETREVKESKTKKRVKERLGLAEKRG